MGTRVNLVWLRAPAMASLIQRDDIYYLQYCVSGKVRRRSLGTNSLQIAREHLRQFESAQLRGLPSPLPSRTPVHEVVAAYVRQIRTVKTSKSAQTDVYYLREVFGSVCDELKITSRRVNESVRKRKLQADATQDLRCRPPAVEAACFEDITTTQLTEFISSQVRRRGLAPKTANRYREILVRLFNWAIKQFGVRMRGDKNPAASVERYRERAPQIRFMTLAQVQEQLHALESKPQLQAMVATLIYAGLRREELTWLTADDIDLKGGTHGMIRVRAKTISGESWQPKTRVNRAVPVSLALRAILDSYTPRSTAEGWFFPSPEGRRWDPDNFSTDLRDANRAVGLPWGCLDFRHTFGSQLAMKGVSHYKIATLMGNSPEICRRHYAALVPEAMTQDVEFAPTSQTNA